MGSPRSRPAVFARSAALWLLAAAAGAKSQETILSGRCAGTQTSPPPFPAQPAAEFSGYKTLAHDGFHPDKNGELVDPAGKAVSVPYAQWLIANADFSKLSLSNALYGQAIMQGYRLDEDACAFKNKNDAWSNADYLALTHYWPSPNSASGDSGPGSGGAGASTADDHVLEMMQTKIGGLPPDAPLSKSVRDNYADMQRLGYPIPKNLASMIQNPATTAGALSRAIANQYSGAQIFDGRTLGQLKNEAAAVNAPGTKMAPYPYDYYPVERRTGELFKGQAISDFSHFASGRALLSRFTDGQGRLRLPAFIFLKTEQSADKASAGAYFTPSAGKNGLIVFNHWNADGILQSHLALQPGMTKAKLNALNADFGDSRKLDKYLADNPEARRLISSDIDEVIYHELVHAWQNRREGDIDYAESKALLPALEPIEKENEAFREQMRFDTDVGVSDRDRLAQSGYYWDIGTALLQNYYGDFTPKVQDIYNHYFAYAASFPEIASAQNMRRRAVSAMPPGAFGDAILKRLRLRALAGGTKALEADEKSYAGRTRVFIQGVLPSLRRAAVDPLAVGYISDGMLYESGNLLTATLESEKSSAEVFGKKWVPAFLASKPLPQTAKEDATVEMVELGWYLKWLDNRPLDSAFVARLRSDTAAWSKLAAALAAKSDPEATQFADSLKPWNELAR